MLSTSGLVRRLSFLLLFVSAEAQNRPLDQQEQDSIVAEFQTYRTGAASWLTYFAQSEVEIAFWSGLVDGYDMAIVYPPFTTETSQLETFLFGGANFYFELSALTEGNESVYNYGVGMGLFICLEYVVSIE